MDDATLIGYLLDALDAETHRRVEGYLLSRPQAWAHVARLRRSLSPLAADAAAPPPAPRLTARTLARLADARRLPDAPTPSAAEVAPGRGQPRRCDVLVVGLFLALLVFLAGPWLG